MIALALLLTQAAPQPPPDDHSGFARSIAFLRDLDEDGCAEIAVGSRSAGASRTGCVLLYSGKTGKLLRRIDGDVPDAGFGTEVCAAGDQDGDGLEDVAAAAPMTRRVKGSGTVEIRSGKDGKRLASVIGTEEELYFGTSLVALGDLDGDGKDELLVRARVGRGPKEHERFAVVSPATGGRLHTIDAPEGSLCRENGVPVAALGDVDGDGMPDFSVEHGAQVFVHSGRTGDRLFTLGQPGAQSAFGASVCPMGDEGIVAGSPGDAAGGIHRFSGRDGRPLGASASEEELRGFGFAVASLGRTDAGLAIVATRCSRTSGGALLLSRGTEETRLEAEPAREGTPLGWRVEAGADVDGDGGADFLISRWWPTSSKGAAVLVFSGRDRKLLREIVP